MEKNWDCLDCQACTVCAHSDSECKAYSEFYGSEISLPAEKETADSGAAA